jgi:hypothetical protein
MKNIHILPTDQPSRLWVNSLLQGKLELSEETLIGSLRNRYIYITSDEEIRKNDYYIHNNRIGQSAAGEQEKGDYKNCKKIILTTDPTLIEDGVQSINDEFLEWFVKNSSCEFVEVEEIGPGFPAGIYWINYLPEHFEKSIPQEEPKQEKEEEYFKHLEKDKKEFAEEWEEIRQEFGFGKQETLEEAAEKYSEGKSSSSVFQEAHKRDFIAGAKWQAEQLYKDDAIQTLEKGLALLLKKQERMYSEEEIMEMFHKFSMHLPFHYEFLVKEQFKKK